MSFLGTRLLNLTEWRRNKFTDTRGLLGCLEVNKGRIHWFLCHLTALPTAESPYLIECVMNYRSYCAAQPPNFQLRPSRRLFRARPFGPSPGQFQAYPDDVATHGPARSRGRRRGVPDPRDVFPRPRDTRGVSKRQWS
jgi:hypothetical protein